MIWRPPRATVLGAMLFGLWPATTAQADNQQLVQDYLQRRGVAGAVLRPVTDDFVSRAFPNFSFFGVVFPQYPVAVLCPPTTDLKCANLFFVRNSQVDFVSTIDDLRFFFAVNLGPAPTQDAATDAVSTWLRFSEEIKQDLFYTFSPPGVSYTARDDLTLLRAHASVAAGGDGNIDVVMTFGAAGSFGKRSGKGCGTARNQADLPSHQIARFRSDRASHGGTGPPGHGPRRKAIPRPSPSQGPAEAPAGNRPYLAANCE